MSTPTAPTPSRPSPRGPALLTTTGVVLVLASLAALVAGTVLFARTLPLDVLAGDGGEGTGVAGVVVEGEPSVMVLEEGRYLLWATAPDGVGVDAGVVREATRIIGPDGPVPVGDPSMTGEVVLGGVRAEAVAGFHAPAYGEHTIEAPGLGPGTAAEPVRLLVTEDPGVAGLAGGVLGTLGLVGIAVLLGAFGIGMTVGGGIWWASRRRAGEAAR